MAKKKGVKKNIANSLIPQLSLFGDLIHEKEDTEEQKAFINYEDDKSIILSATAGSGKTYSCVQRLKELLNRGVDPKRIIFFSFTKAATEELQERVGNDEVKITTIHAFSLGLLSAMGKFKKISTFYDFLIWFKEKYKSHYSASSEKRHEFEKLINEMYEEAEQLASSISSFKLQMADGIKCNMPPIMIDYNKFMKETRSRDFSDMLIEVRNLLKEEKWLNMFKNKYDYIFIDEYQDTSTIQLQILLSLNAKHYYLVGDKFQSIFAFSNSNCDLIEEMLLERRITDRLTLSTNFRSDINIVSNSNKYSDLKAVPSSKNEGVVHEFIMFEIDKRDGQKIPCMIDILDKHNEVAVLVRTNAVIKKLEYEMLRRKYPMRYFNFITEDDFKQFKSGKVSISLKRKLDSLKDVFRTETDIFLHIEQNKKSKKFITSIHKSKGREFETCILVNSVSQELLNKIGLLDKLTKKQLNYISFDPMGLEDMEPRNIHYVGVSRSKHQLYYMLYDWIKKENN